MLFILGFMRRPDFSFSTQKVQFTQTPENLPRLIALEPTSIFQKVPQAPPFPTITIKPGLATIQSSISSTPTPLILLNGQQPEIIGYSVERRPLEVYTFGSGEHERMIVAGIHGGDEWNTVTLANQLIKHLNQKPSDIPDDITLYVLPSLNPDGEARAHS